MPDQMQACRPDWAGRARRTAGTGIAFLTRWTLRPGAPLRACRTLRTRAAHEREHRNGGEDGE
jgi:hypothetical protein